MRLMSSIFSLLYNDALRVKRRMEGNQHCGKSHNVPAIMDIYDWIIVEEGMQVIATGSLECRPCLRLNSLWPSIELPVGGTSTSSES
uniref:Uncharacterized protein n=1 Tax=Romanomermis culicivorax TaxID=13658 RepID=A0A915KA49_ROMCU